MVDMNNLILDAPYRIGVSGKYRLQVLGVASRNFGFEYALVDSQLKGYMSTSKSYYAVGAILCCIVNFEIEQGKLVVSSTEICCKQDFAVPVQMKATSRPSVVPSNAGNKIRKSIGMVLPQFS